jgi:hypothetical protein
VAEVSDQIPDARSQKPDDLDARFSHPASGVWYLASGIRYLIAHFSHATSKRMIWSA